ncbi:transketolase [Idiomarina loihiensis]|uniref:Transketolase n=1 Tax=Idiomarina loihiensis (strain ATCC BAA-735 / DSM 15497 / L2-TR) TaxID=283942 RepID=Q5QVM8_IDILO|nr:transketolase [Idiomarina loihiensis]AAV83046.1 Transketolase [Idiomarina loihiensis L2TR]AGM37091.1 transketolase [Idiomarina loihiensis GSL 199]
MSERQYLANAIRALSMDAVQKAKSGHPGAPMGMADIAEVLWRDYLKHNPHNPGWADRDRFVLSNGHGSMLIYSLLHLSGYDLSIEDIKQFRQLDSKTPGHPEYGYTPGIETTTGPLGQGLANAVGMALAEKVLAAQFNRDNHEIVDHHTYTFLGDGCLMEGISHEVCSLAGTLGLGKLIAFYDDNGISIDGEVEGWFTDDTAKRFESYGWHVINKVDGHDSAAITRAIDEARANDDKPTLIICKTVIGYGAPNKQGSESCHGAPLGDDEIVAARKQLNWPHQAFEVPADVYQKWSAVDKGAAVESSWNKRWVAYEQEYPQLAKELKRRLNGELPEGFENTVHNYAKQLQSSPEAVATRKASLNVLNEFGPKLPELLGGSADLAGSNLTLWNDAKGITADDASGNYVFYGVREFGMSAIMNGVTLHGGFKAYGATFLMFMEYARNAVRMSALMKQPSIFVYTHDSIGLGEDGPTHQPVEQLANLRQTPNLQCWRPCDQVETAVAWGAAVQSSKTPSALVFSRQGMQQQERNDDQLTNIARGGYVLKDSDGEPDVILIATGSEVDLAVNAFEQLTEEGHKVRVVSMPSTNVFDIQDAEYKESVLPSSVTRRVAVEAGIADFWYKYVGLNGEVVGMTTFGESAPAGDLYKHFGITTENTVAAAKRLLGA